MLFIKWYINFVLHIFPSSNFGLKINGIHSQKEVECISLTLVELIVNYWNRSYNIVNSYITCTNL